MIPRKGIFVSGTDTHIGKTVTSALLVSALKSNGIPAGYFKPIQTGPDSDTQTVTTLAALSRQEFVPPVYYFPQPLAPSQAAELNQSVIELENVRRSWQELPRRTWVVEGAGGLLVPLNAKQTIRDLVQLLELDLMVVASTRLGTINHTLLTLEAAQTKGIQVRGIVLVGEPNAMLVKTISNFHPEVPIIQVPPIERMDAEETNRVASVVFAKAVLEGAHGS